MKLPHSTLYSTSLWLFASLLAFSTAQAGSGHAHSEPKSQHEQPTHSNKAGPNGGRVITSVEPHFEFFLTAERFAQITFLDARNQPIPVAEQSIHLIGGDRQTPTVIDFTAQEGRLVSKTALPEIAQMPIVLQIKPAPAAKTVRAKFYLNLNRCGSCSYQEYACICGH